MSEYKIESKYFVIVHVMFMICSLTSVLNKLAAQENKIGIRFLVFYGGTLALMGIYAIVWQQIIKKIPLMVAYANKAVVIVWGLLWGVLFFNEDVTIGKVVGVAMVISGVVLFARSSGENVL